MSNTKMGADCCGDRYNCNTTIKCACGCDVFFCRSCYASHMIEIANQALKSGFKPNPAWVAAEREEAGFPPATGKIGWR